MIAAAVAMFPILTRAGGSSDAPGRLFHSKCSACHSDQIPLNMEKDRRGWEETVKLMQQKRPGFISERDAKIIVNYLLAHSQSAFKGK